MPLIEIYKARRKTRKPEWQDVRPTEAEARAAYNIADKNVQKWSRAFMAMTRELITPDVEKEILRHLRANNQTKALNAIPWGKTEVWERLSRKLKNAYLNVIKESAEDTFKRGKIPLRYNIAKAEKKITGVPINPWSIKWMETQSAKLIKEVSKSTKKAVRHVISDAFKKGVRPTSILDRIKTHIGLLKRESMAVEKKFETMLAAGVPAAKARARADRYAASLLNKRAERIARTETTTAQSRGRLDAWRTAVKNDEMPKGVKREWVAVVVSPRTCEICESLDGEQVGLDENYYSKVLGREVEGPGSSAHPHCRCTEIIRTPKEAAKPKPERVERFNNQKAWEASLAAPALAAFTAWSAEAQSLMMRQMDSGIPGPTLQRASAETKERVKKRLDAIYDSVKIAPVYQGKIYRGISGLTPEEVEALATPGNIFTLENLSSFSSSKKVGVQYAMAQKAPIVFELDTTKGTYDISKLALEDEKEVLALKGKKFKVLSVKTERDPETNMEYRLVKLREL